MPSGAGPEGRAVFSTVGRNADVFSDSELAATAAGRLGASIVAAAPPRMIRQAIANPILPVRSEGERAASERSIHVLVRRPDYPGCARDSIRLESALTRGALLAAA